MVSVDQEEPGAQSHTLQVESLCISDSWVLGVSGEVDEVSEMTPDMRKRWIGFGRAADAEDTGSSPVAKNHSCVIRYPCC